MSITDEKYGFQYTMAKLAGRVRAMLGKDSGTDTAVIITLP